MGSACFKVCSAASKTKGSSIQCLIQLPTNNIAGIPVKYGDQVHQAFWYPDVGNVDSPHVVGPDDCKIPYEIGINAMLLVALAQVGAGIDGCKSRLPHILLNRIAVNVLSLTMEHSCDPSRPKNGYSVYLRRISSGEGGTGL